MLRQHQICSSSLRYIAALRNNHPATHITSHQPSTLPIGLIVECMVSLQQLITKRWPGQLLATTGASFPKADALNSDNRWLSRLLSSSGQMHPLSQSKQACARLVHVGGDECTAFPQTLPEQHLAVCPTLPHVSSSSIARLSFPVKLTHLGRVTAVTVQCLAQRHCSYMY